MDDDLAYIYSKIQRPQKPAILKESLYEYPLLAKWIDENMERLQYLVDTLPYTQPEAEAIEPITIDSVLRDMLSDVIDVWLERAEDDLDVPGDDADNTDNE